MSNENIRELAYEDYCAGLKYKEIADKYNVKLSTIKSWATRYWKKKKLQPKEKVATKSIKRLQPQNEDTSHKIVKELGPGEAVELTPEEMKELNPAGTEMKICSFLWTYYGYPTSDYEGVNVEVMRYKNGRILAENDKEKNQATDIDYVSGVPDSGTPHAIGYANQSRIPFARPFIKYTPTWPRSFMPANQSDRNKVAKMKQIPILELIKDFYADESHMHMVTPGMLYISHPTELGTLYSFSELEAISRVCRKAGIPLYLDGARLGYGLAADGTDVTLKDVARLCDVFYIGGTKIGTLFGEAVVVTRPDLLKNFIPLVKQHGALLAKGRLLGVQFETLFTDGLYMEISRHAVNMAMKLKKAFTDNGYRLFIDSPTNQQFVYLPNEEIDRLRKIASFELWGPRKDKETPVRFVTNWATREEDVNEFISHLVKEH